MVGVPSTTSYYDADYHTLMRKAHYCSDSTLYYTDALERHSRGFFCERVKEKKTTSYKIFTKTGNAQHVQ